jgi:hypothetical protein
MRVIVIILLLIGCNLIPQKSQAWGFFAHQRINRLAVFSLPPEMVSFYKRHIVYITENAVNPDKRRYAVKNEAPRHYIDVDIYGDSAVYKMPRYWKEAVAKYTEDTLMAYGIVPWHIHLMKYQLTEALRAKNIDRIIRNSSDMGHYIADACVPLHTTENYNGQLTGQRGIHGLWESRLPELLSQEYDMFVGKAAYIKNSQLRAWEAVTRSHAALDSVFGYEKELTKKFPEEKKYSFEERGGVNTRVYSKAFSKEYHEKLNGQVERQMRYSVLLVSSYWYTCWVDAGQPDLNSLLGDVSAAEKKLLQEEQIQYQKGTHKSREDEAFLVPSSVDDDTHAGCIHSHAIYASYK